ncbi:hypothetical protein LY76DRAFT_595440 [Colletotrichum caudatum]|nr:hypothetical protein LY76DRAFT_595440 [Colletotrichum caudatum]
MGRIKRLFWRSLRWMSTAIAIGLGLPRPSRIVPSSQLATSFVMMISSAGRRWEEAGGSRATSCMPRESMRFDTPLGEAAQNALPREHVHHAPFGRWPLPSCS